LVKGNGLKRNLGQSLKAMGGEEIKIPIGR
jgi:hypothetical protein